jgi:hypothetical protein
MSGKLTPAPPLPLFFVDCKANQSRACKGMAALVRYTSRLAVNGSYFTRNPCRQLALCLIF